MPRGSVAMSMAAGLALCLGTAWEARAEEPEARTEQSTRTARRTDAVTVITRQEIERRQWRTLTDVLRAQPGIHVSSLGGRGQDALLFFRGNPNGTVLLRMDGIDLSDPSSEPSGSLGDPDARSAGQIVPDLLTENIERIEIVRGPQSARYGSDAIGGVIEIETRGGSGTASPWASFEAGGFGTTQQSAGIAGGGERAGYAFAYANAHTRGISAAPVGLGGHERDRNDNDTLSGRLDFAPGDAVSLRVTGRRIVEDIQLDDPAAVPLALTAGVDPGLAAAAADRRNREGERRRLYLGAEASVALLDERWVQTFGVRYGDHDVRDDQSERATVQLFEASPELESFALAGRDGTRLSFDWRSDVRLGEAHTLTLGAETERESTHASRLRRQDFLTFGVTLPGSPLPAPRVLRTQTRERGHESLRNQALFAVDRFAYGDAFGELAVRLHDHDEYGSGLTYRAGIGYLEPRSRVRLFASVGTAFRDPDPALGADRVVSFETPDILGAAVRRTGLAEITLPGDRTLERAVSRGMELGVEGPLLDERVRLGATLFASRVRGLQSAATVLFTPEGQRVQVFGFNDSADARTRGVELSAAWSATAWLDLSLDYTYTHAELAHVRSEGFAVVFEGASAGPDQIRDLALLAFGAPLLNPSGADLPGIPKHELHARVGLRPWDGVELGLVARHIGTRSGTRLIRTDRLGGYTLFDLSGSYALGERLTLFARLENLFDKGYRDLELAGQPGFAGFLGLRAVF